MSQNEFAMDSRSYCSTANEMFVTQSNCIIGHNGKVSQNCLPVHAYTPERSLSNVLCVNKDLSAIGPWSGRDQ